MTRWAKGADRISALIEARDLQRVVADSDTVSALLSSAHRHVESACLTVNNDPEAAYTLAYDAARKSATALLNHQGLRATSAGGHIAVVDAIRAQFPGVPGLTSRDRLRRRRNQAEYPDFQSYDPITTDEADGAIETARQCIASAAKLLELDQLGIF